MYLILNDCNDCSSVKVTKLLHKSLYIYIYDIQGFFYLYRDSNLPSLKYTKHYITVN